MTIHDNECPLSGSVVKLTNGNVFKVDDWWDRVQNTSWRESNHKLAIEYSARRAMYNLPENDNVIYGLMNGDVESLINSCEIADFQ